MKSSIYNNCWKNHTRLLVYSRTNNEFCLFLLQYPVGDSHNINDGMRASDGSGGMLGLQEQDPSRGMRYLVNITSIFHVAARSTSSPTRTHKIWNKDAQRKEGTTHTHGSMAHVSALGLVRWVYCSMLQQIDGCWGQSPGNRRRSSEHDHMYASYIR